MILTVGSIALDTIETPHEKSEDVLGGSATYICGATAKLADTALIGIVGTDFPDRYSQLFVDWGVDTEGLEVAGGSTFRWSGRYHSDMIHRDTLSTELGVFETFNPVIPDSKKKAEYIALGNIHPDLQHSILDQVEKPKWVVADTMKLWIDIARDSLDRLISRVDAIVVNDEEARDLTGEISLTSAAAVLLEKGPSAVIVKRGEHGASLHMGEDLFYSPAFPLHKVFDTTGAGDTFLGGLIGWVAKKDSADPETLKEGIHVGSCLASFTVESFGVQSLNMANSDGINKRLEVLRGLTEVPEIVL
ncbi:MAG: sugar kinase [Candidatus Omnitrophica bacterium]|nr:sugar kinase [Candidatus Omnitrophota bacterium]